MTPDETEAVAHRWHLEVVQTGNLEVADAILAPDVVVHANGQEVRGLDAAKQLASLFPLAFPDLQITHHEAIVVGNRVAIRLLPKGETRGTARRVDRSARLELESPSGLIERITVDQVRDMKVV